MKVIISLYILFAIIMCCILYYYLIKELKQWAIKEIIRISGETPLTRLSSLDMYNKYLTPKNLLKDCNTYMVILYSIIWPLTLLIILFKLSIILIKDIINSFKIISNSRK